MSPMRPSMPTSFWRSGSPRQVPMPVGTNRPGMVRGRTRTGARLCSRVRSPRTWFHSSCRVILKPARRTRPMQLRALVMGNHRIVRVRGRRPVRNPVRSGRDPASVELPAVRHTVAKPVSGPSRRPRVFLPRRPALVRSRRATHGARDRSLRNSAGAARDHGLPPCAHGCRKGAGRRRQSRGNPVGAPRDCPGIGRYPEIDRTNPCRRQRPSGKRPPATTARAALTFASIAPTMCGTGDADDRTLPIQLRGAASPVAR